MVFRPYFRKNALLTPKATTTPYFTSTQLSSIYKYPKPNESISKVVAVLSFGGGVTGTVSPTGVLTGGDIQAHWTYLGIPAAMHPKVVVVLLGGATNSPNPSDGATIENIIDVEIIGAMYPSPNLTIILYIAPNTLAGFTQLLNAAATPITVNGQAYKPSVISCSWGAGEFAFSHGELTSLNAQMQALASAGITMTAATGDNGSSDGGIGVNVDFPSSSPYSLACGGTTLVCPNRVYDAQTVETAWLYGGGGVSVHFAKPAYQSNLIGVTGRATPDIAMNADPNTGVIFTVGGVHTVIGGTSIVAPAMAAFLALVNTNQFVTQNLRNYPSSSFHDVTSGKNGAYAAKVGYDTCTGWGSINGSVLSTYIAGPVVPVTGIAFGSATSTVSAGSTYQLQTLFTPINATNKTVTYSSNNTLIATVSATGVVTGVSPGTTVVTVRTAAGTFSSTATITVTPVIPTSVSISTSSATVNVGGKTTLVATVLPAISTNKTLTWSSSNNAVATVNSSGVVSGISNGTVTITAITVSGGAKSALVMTVLTPVTGISVHPTSVSLAVRGNVTLVPTVQPATASNKTVLWISQNTAIATVSASGVLHGVRHGSTTVRATAGAYGAIVNVVVN